MKKITLLLTLLLATAFSFGQTVLSVGDIAFVGSNSDGLTSADDTVAFVLLKDIDAATNIIFTDMGWNDGTGFFATAGDGQFTWTSGAAMTAGTVVTINMANLLPLAASYSSIGDQLFAIQGSTAAPVFIAGLQFNDITGGGNDANWDGAATTNSTSALPDALVTGVTAVRLVPEQDNWQFSCVAAGGSPVSGTANDIRLIVNNRANWVSDNDNPYIPALEAGCTFTVTAGGDTTPPVITCAPTPPTITAGIDGLAAIPDLVSGTSATDDVSDPGNITITQSPTAGTMYYSGVYPVTLTATDEAGNSASCIINITINEPPTTTLAAGDIAFVGFNLDGGDGFAFIILKDIIAGTNIKLSDCGVNNPNTINCTSGDSTNTWYAPTAMSAGTIVSFDGTFFTAPLAIQGDQIIAFQGTVASPVFIAAIHSNIEVGITNDADWDGAALNNDESALPDQLTNGINAIRLYTAGPPEMEVDNWQFDCSLLPGGTTLTGTPAEIAAIINDIQYWSSNDLTEFVPAAKGTCIYVVLPDVQDTNVTLVAGVLTIEDTVDKDDDLTISYAAGVYTITDNNGGLITCTIPGSTGDGTNTVTVPNGGVTSVLTTTLGGDDMFTVDFSGDDFTVPVNYEGGSQAAGDALTLTGGGTFADITHEFLNENDGNIAITGNAQITYTGLEPVIDNLLATNRVFNFTGSAETIALSDDANPGDNISFIDSSLGESVTFLNPTTSLTINTEVGGGSGADILNIEGLDSLFDADLTINGGTDDNVFFQTNPTNIGSGNYNINGQTIKVSENVMTAITGVIAFTATQNILLNSAAQVSSVDGDITFNANAAGTLAGVTSSAIVITDTSTISATGLGDINLTGIGVSTGLTSFNYGIVVNGNSIIESTGSGSISLTGTGGDGADVNQGMRIEGAGTQITTINGGITLDGTGGDGSGNFNQGITIYSGATIQDLGTGNITIIGVAGIGIQENRGVDIVNTATTIQSNGGDINITGTGNAASSGAFNLGISIRGGTTIATTNNGEIILNGTSGGGSGANYGLEFVSAGTSVSTANGNITLNGNSTSTSGTTNFGTFIDASINATGSGNIFINGTGGNGTGDDLGIYTLSNTAISSNSGNIQINGTSATATTPAIDITALASAITTTGAITATANIGKLNTPAGVPGYAIFDATTSMINGIFAAGQSPGQAIIIGDFNIGLGDTVEIEVDDINTPGTEYDQIVVNGTVDITDATLTIVENFAGVFPAGHVLILIDNDGADAVVGEFNGLPNNSPIIFNGQNLIIKYDGGDGNDVVLVADSLPTAVCQDITVQLDASGNVSIVASEVDGGSSDPDGPVTLSIDISSFDCSNIGPNTVTLTVTDNTGNTASCTATVTVEDMVPPVANCAAPFTIQLDATGNASITVGDIENGSTDACGIATTTIDKSTFTCADTGPNTITLTVTDVNGNVSTCTTTVTVEDNIAPTAICQNITLQLDATGNVVLNPDDLDGGSSDNCAGALSLIAATTNDEFLRFLDPATYATVSPDITMTIGGIAVAGVNGMDKSPIDNLYYIIVKPAAGGRKLGTLDPSTGVVTTIGPNFSENFAGITFDAAGNLYGVSGDGSATPETLFTINTTNGAITQVLTLGNGDDGEAIAFNPDDGLIYHWSGLSTRVMETIDPLTLTVTNIPLTGFNANEVAGAKYAGGGEFIINNIGGTFVRITTAGVATFEGTGVARYKGLEYYGAGSSGNLTFTASQTNFSCADVGGNSVTLTVTDQGGNTDTCIATVTIEDNVAPTATCQPFTAQLDGTGTVTITGADVDGGSTDACGIATLSVSPDTFTCADLGPNTVTLTVTDVNGNTSTCTTVVTVEDNEDPVITCVPNATRDTDPGVCQYTVVGTEFDATFTDNCANGNITNNYNGTATMAGEVLTKGVYTVVWTVDDGNGQTATCNTIITVEDNEPPVITCVPNATRDTDPGVCDYTVIGTEFDATFTDNCSSGIIANNYNSTSTLAGAVFPLGNTDVVWAVFDGNGQVAFCTTRITIQDNEAPIITCVPNGTRDTDPGLCDYTVIGTEFDATFTDNCTSGSISNNFNGLATLAGAIIPKGVTTVVWTANDGHGQTATCTTVITVEDNEDPIITCVPNATRDTDPGLCNYTVVGNEFDATFTDNCPDGSISNDYNGTATMAGEILPKGVTTVVWTVNDGNGQTATCTTVITVEDNEDPIITCVPNATRDTDPGLCNYTVVGNEFDATFTDNCPDGSISNDYNGTATMAGEILPKGVTTVVWTVNDGNGQTATCTTVITVEDNEDPIITCVPNATRDTDPGLCNYTVVGNEFDATFTDNCPDGSISNDYNGTATMAGEILPKGVTTVVWTVNDGNGQTATCTTVITVEDNEDPIITCVPNATRDTDPGLCNYTVVGNEFDATFTDNCPDGSISNDYNGTATMAGEILPKGVTTVVWTVNDGNGQTATCTTVITVEDNEDPIITCVPNATRDTDPGLCNYTVVGNEFDATFTDNCPDGSISNDYNGTATMAGEILPKGVTTVVWTVNDGNGQTATCTTVITVEDNEDPIITCVPNATRDTDPGLCNYTVVGNEFDATFTDNCPDGSISNDYNGTATMAGEILPKGVTTVVWTVNDGNGQTATCTTVITVEDNEDPVIACVPNATRDTDPGVCEYTVVGNEFDATFTDNCTDGSITNNYNGTTTMAGEILPTGTTTVIWTVNDGNGQSASCTTVITIQDNAAPTIVCPANITANTDGGECFATVTFAAPLAFDNCGIASVVQTMGDPSGSGFPVGVNTIEFTATDVNGNTSTCSFTITVTDNEAPVAVCQNITIQLDASGNATIVAADVDGGSTDQCGVASIAIDVNTFDCSDVGDNNVILTVTDVNGNTSTCTAIVTVEDVTAPVVVCQDITVELDPVTGMVTIAGIDVDGGSTDACGIDTYTLDMDTFDCSNVGDNLVTLTVTDVNGNVSTCTATVTVEDNTSPVLVCQDFTLELGADGTATLDPSDVIASNTDNCGIFASAVDISAFDCSDIGAPITVQVFTIDVNGNLSTCTAQVTVVDLLAPVITCPADQTVDPGPGNIFYILPDYFVTGEATAIDNCTDPVTITSQSPAAGTPLSDGTYTITLTATDEYGNTSTCDFELIVESVLGTGDITQNMGSIKMYPVPAKNIVNISNPQSLELERLEIYDLRGRLVQTTDLRGMGNVKTINIDQLAASSYYVKIKGAKGEITKRLLKE